MAAEDGVMQLQTKEPRSAGSTKSGEEAQKDSSLKPSAGV